MEALAIAANDAGSLDGAEVAAAMASFTDVPLVTGPTTYTETCHIPIGREMVMIQVQDGSLGFAAEVTPTFLTESIC